MERHMPCFYTLAPDGGAAWQPDCGHPECRRLEALISRADQVSRDIYSQMSPGGVRAMEREIAALRREKEALPLYLSFKALVESA